MITRNVLGFSVAPHMRRVMSLNGFHASIMRADKKKEKDGSGLPKGLPIPVLPVDYLKERPESWVGGAGSYVVPVDSEWGLWFNWSMNKTSSTAVLCSVKGMNPVTGQRIGGYDLEKIEKKCPTHGVDLYAHNYCPECDFNWPEQNYISAPNPLFLDGFRTPDGNVRQFYFTEEMAKSIPELVIGKEDTVPAFGFCFYDQKVVQNYEEGKRLREEYPSRTLSNFSSKAFTITGSDASKEMNFGDIMKSASHGLYPLYIHEDSSPTFGSTIEENLAVRERGVSFDSSSINIYHSSTISDGGMDATLDGTISPMGVSPDDADYSEGEEKTSGGITIPDSFRGMSTGPRKKNVKRSDLKKVFSKTVRPDSMLDVFAPLRKSAEVGIGAGAKIKQAFRKSRLGLDTWNEKPSSVVRIYFVFQEQFEQYAAAGFNNLEGTKDGYLEGLPVGGSK